MPALIDFLSASGAEVLDRGFRLLPTLSSLVLSPGQLSSDFVEGRGDYTHPVRLFLLAGAVAFLASRLSHGLLFVLSLSMIAAAVGDDLAVAVTLVVAVPANALLLRMFFGGSRPLYLVHLVFTLHFFSFFLLLSAVESAVGAVAGRSITTNWIPGVAAALLLLSYAMIAMRTFYGGSWWRLFTKSLAIGLIYLTAFGWLQS